MTRSPKAVRLAVLATCAAAAAASEGAFSYGPYTTHPALHYYRHWAKGRIERALRDIIGPAPAASDAVQALQAHELSACGRALSKEGAWELHSSAREPATGTFHGLLRSKEDQSLQYLALHGDRVIAMDPPACRRRSHTMTALEARRLDEEKEPTKEPEPDKGPTTEPDKGPTAEPGAAASTSEPAAATTLDPDLFRTGQNVYKDPVGDPSLLDPTHDPMVKDCVELFHRTADDTCQDDFDIKVLSASITVINGFSVLLYTNVTGKAGHTVPHRIWCNFQVAPKDEAKEAIKDLAKDELLYEEKQGLVATVEMTLDICDADEKTSVSPEAAHALRMLEQYGGFGELSLVKGYEHVNDDIPIWNNPRRLQANPAEVDLRVKFPTCFPGNRGSNVVRNQGNCGSCWAFASASSLMNTLCTSKNGKNSFKSANTERHEVSVQRIMSCNQVQMGCGGGYAQASATSYKNCGVATESDVPYACGIGNPLDHFQDHSKVCTAFPWGCEVSKACAKAVAKPEWTYTGYLQVKGMDDMMAQLAQGNALYVTFNVPQAFMGSWSGVYDKPGSLVGGHAVTAVGYGALNGKLYWWLQNSWGPNWGEGGYCKFLRGTNFMGIEEGGVLFKGNVADDGPSPNPGPTPAPTPTPAPPPPTTQTTKTTTFLPLTTTQPPKDNILGFNTRVMLLGLPTAYWELEAETGVITKYQNGYYSVVFDRPPRFRGQRITGVNVGRDMLFVLGQLSVVPDTLLQEKDGQISTPETATKLDDNLVSILPDQGTPAPTGDETTTPAPAPTGAAKYLSVLGHAVMSIFGANKGGEADKESVSQARTVGIVTIVLLCSCLVTTCVVCAAVCTGCFGLGRSYSQVADGPPA